jgi:formiminoglutamase
VTPASLPDDPLWTRVSEWIVPVTGKGPHTADLAIVGVPAFRTSITPTHADTTPRAVRGALARYSTYPGSRDVDLSALGAIDVGDVHDPDGPAGELRVAAALTDALDSCDLLIALGGDNSITYSVANALMAGRLGDCGLITLDAHHDLRDGVSNGSPVRRLIEAGLPGDHVVQIGIADFSNSAAYAARARELGITVVPRPDLRGADLSAITSRALDVAGRGGGPVYVDLDLDVCDRAAVPGCPSAAPGGISADELRQFAYLLARNPRVRALDITEVDASIDSPDGRTVRLAALLLLEAATGLATRKAIRP